MRRRALTTVAASWVAHVGSANERPGITGFAHLFEHMMFKGTPTIGTKDIARDLEIIAEQEAVQNQIRAVYREQRARWRRGEIAVGMQADMVLYDLRGFELAPLNNAVQQLVFSERGFSVKTVLVGGEVIYDDGRYGFGDADAVVSEALRMRKVQKTRNADLYRLASQLSGELG